MEQKTERHECIRCGEAPPADDEVYCGHCYWKVRAEVQAGLYELRAYLARWQAFRDWEAHQA